MADRLEQLRAHTRRAAGTYSMSMGYENDKLTKVYRDILLEQKNALSQFECTAEAVAELCVQKGLPGGKPCWISELIMSYT